MVGPVRPLAALPGGQPVRDASLRGTLAYGDASLGDASLRDANLRGPPAGTRA
jgi:uncharacterized protein YjbI with pentapeptide repeats